MCSKFFVFLYASSRDVVARWPLEMSSRCMTGCIIPGGIPVGAGGWLEQACQGWNAPAHLPLAERKQIPLSLNGGIAPHRLDSTQTCELRLWFEHLILQIQGDSHNTNVPDAGNPMG